MITNSHIRCVQRHPPMIPVSTDHVTVTLQKATGHSAHTIDELSPHQVMLGLRIAKRNRDQANIAQITNQNVKNSAETINRYVEKTN
jgi:hypothetical protein